MVKFLSKFRRGGGDEADAGSSQPPATAQVPQLQEPSIQVAPEPPTESSFVESSYDADPVDAPVTQPPPTIEVKKGKKEKKTSRMHMFKKRSEQEPREQQPAREKSTVHRHRAEDMDEARQEQIAMDTFQYRIHQSRASGYSQYGTLKAPGFDYLNWRPYGYPRYPHSNPESYLQQIHALVPYVYDVVVSGCQGVEERRWDALTKSADEKAESTAQSRDVSAMGSRAQSRDRLVSN